ncbi:hypothetical protein BH09GEM1_BH09GEM1_34420 [soil metagenome]
MAQASHTLKTLQFNPNGLCVRCFCALLRWRSLRTSASAVPQVRAKQRLGGVMWIPLSPE